MSQIIHSDTIPLNTKGFGDTIDISDAVEKIRQESGVTNGIVTVHVIDNSFVFEYLMSRRWSREATVPPGTITVRV